jgi:predicted TIM-barrel fold metal-dependent hydrolase
MTIETDSQAQQIRAQIDHPVIDADGHTIEVMPVLLDFLDEVGGPDAVDRFRSRSNFGFRRKSTMDERREYWNNFPSHWPFPAKNTLDRATAALPRLYYDRMEELGLDFSVVYPTFGLRVQMMHDDELRQMLCRALNHYMSEMHSGLADRLMPVASIPMHTPTEAIAELEYAVDVLGMKAVLMPSFVQRPIPAVHRDHPEYRDVAFRVDTYGIDSEYDYDPVWAKFVELKVVPGVHTPTQGYGFRQSISNYVYNHIGMFATSCEAVSKSLLMGGVFHRFPDIKLAALEGGAGWVTSLYADFIGHWEKRNASVIQDLNPEQLDRELLHSLFEQYGPERVRNKMDAVMDNVTNPVPAPGMIDEFAACPFDSAEQIRDMVASHIYVGCEADDPLNSLAFNSRMNPYGAKFRIVFGSDISHWDVPDVRDVLKEAYELVEHELIDEDEFREFTFTNAARMYAETNPDFFRGTAVESTVAALLA